MLHTLSQKIGLPITCLPEISNDTMQTLIEAGGRDIRCVVSDLPGNGKSTWIRDHAAQLVCIPPTPPSKP